MKYSGEFFDSSMFLLRYTAITAKLKNNKEKKKEIIANKDVQPGTCIMPKILKNTAAIVKIDERNETMKPRNEVYRSGL
tara:strand:- start:67 stop:303 length:237 start_codon:yes stop_codon:yes gene_type:complete